MQKKAGLRGMMGNSEEPQYQRFDGICRRCGEGYHYCNSVKRHRDFEICDDCEREKIAEVLTGEKTFDAVVKGWG